MEKKQKIYIGLILLLFVTLVILGEVRHSKIAEHASFSEAHILSFDEHFNNKLGRCLTYSFSINGKIIIDKTCSYSFNDIFYQRNDLYKKRFLKSGFPVIYNKKNHEHNLLIFENDFHSFNISFPDSLNWTKDY